MRKRKRPDYSQRVFKLRAYPLNEQGEPILRQLTAENYDHPVWTVARRQQTLWNDLVILADWTAEWARLLGDKKSAWQNFDAEVNRRVKQSNLDWVNGPDVGDRLKTAIRSHRWPHRHGGLDQVHLGHRFTGGGIKIEQIVDNPRMSRVGLSSNGRWWLPNLIESTEVPALRHPPLHAPAPLADHWHFRFEVTGQPVVGAVNLHRQIPTGAILKRVGLVGSRVGARWFWHLVLTIEEPEVSRRVSVETQYQRVAGLDLGWRLFADGTPRDYLRIGMLADSEGRMIELRLPLALRPGPKSEGRNRMLGYLAEAQGKADEALNRARALAGDQRLGARGLRAFLRDSDRTRRETVINLADSGSDSREANAVDIAKELAQYDFWRRRLAEQRYKMIERRRWWYRNLAKFLCERYSRIALEADMRLPALHERSDDPALRAAARYRNYAAVGELRQYLALYATRTGTVIEGETANTTRTCWECGALSEPSAELFITCPNGHRVDQDVQASINLLQQIGGTAHMVTGWRLLVVPDNLRRVLVEVTR